MFHEHVLPYNSTEPPYRVYFFLSTFLWTFLFLLHLQILLPLIIHLVLLSLLFLVLLHLLLLPSPLYLLLSYFTFSFCSCSRKSTRLVTQPSYLKDYVCNFVLLSVPEYLRCPRLSCMYMSLSSTCGQLHIMFCKR